VRIVQLDLLRCFAVLLVLARHMRVCPPEAGSWAHEVSAVLQRGGWIGVDIFFVLSGFLVSGLLFREYRSLRTVHATRFLVRRGLKIYPAFWLMLAATIAHGVVTGSPLPQEQVVGEVLFLQNYVGALWWHTWSLAVEEHFYLLLALFAAWVVRHRSDRESPFDLVPRAWAVVAVVCLGWRLLLAHATPYAHQTHLFPTHLRIDSLFFGVLLSYYWHFGKLETDARIARLRWPLLVVGCALLAPAFVFPVETTTWIHTVGISLFTLGSGAVLVALLHLEVARSRIVRALAAIGAFSYSLYLWHLPVLVWGTRMVESALGHRLGWWSYAAFALGATVLVGVAASKLVEYPVLRLRDRLFPSLAGGALRPARPTREAKAP